MLLMLYHKGLAYMHVLVLNITSFWLVMDGLDDGSCCCAPVGIYISTTFD